MFTNSEEEEEEGNQESKRLKLETNPLQIGSILEKIFSFLDLGSIMRARKVNKVWSAEGAKILITKCFVKIPSDLRVKNSSWFIKIKEWVKFKQFLSYKSREAAVIPNIKIQARGDLQLWKSLGVLGPQVKSLKISFIGGEEKWFSNLLDLLPNLNNVSFAPCRHTVNEKLVTKLINYVLSRAKKDLKPLVITSMILKAKNVVEFEEIEKFSDCSNIKFREDLTFGIDADDFSGLPNVEVRISEILSKFLSKAQDTLKQLYLYDCEGILPLLDFPCLTSLEHLDIKFCGENLDQFNFSPSFRFSEKIPNLKSIVIESGWGRSDYFVNPFENAGAAPSVTRVEINNVNDSTIARLFQLFPNLEDLDIRNIDCSEKMFQSIWKQGRNLITLNISIEMDEFSNGVPDFDHFITGFDPWTLEMLRKQPNWTPYTLEHLEKLRVNPSVLDLKDLEELTLYFSRSEGSSIPEKMLVLAGEYAFRLMPRDSRVVISMLYSNDSDDCFMAAFDEVTKLPNVTWLWI